MLSVFQAVAGRRAAWSALRKPQGLSRKSTSMLHNTLPVHRVCSATCTTSRTDLWHANTNFQESFEASLTHHSKHEFCIWFSRLSYSVRDCSMQVRACFFFLVRGWQCTLRVRCILSSHNENINPRSLREHVSR